MLVYDGAKPRDVARFICVLLTEEEMAFISGHGDSMKCPSVVKKAS